jgi:polar amino acid transport system substrate-binding protein
MKRPQLFGQIVAIGIFVWSLAAQAECTRVIISADPSYPPLQWFDGEKLQGASVDIAKRMLDELGLSYEVRYVGPFARLMHIAERGEIDLVATLKRTPEREKFLLFPETPALSNPVAVFALRSHSFNFGGRQDLVGLRGGVTRGNKFGDGFDEFLKQNLSVEEADSPENNFKKLEAGRIDYFVTGYYTGMAFLLKRGDEDKFSVLRPFVADAMNFIAFTRNGNCSEKLVAADAVLARLKKNGVLDDLVKKSFQTWKQRPVLAEKM